MSVTYTNFTVNGTIDSIFSPHTGPSLKHISNTVAATIKILGVVGVFTSVYNIATAEDKGKQTAKEVVGWAGAIAGAEALGSAGSVAGPWGSLIGGFLGGILGYMGATSILQMGESAPKLERPWPVRDNVNVMTR